MNRPRLTWCIGALVATACGPAAEEPSAAAPDVPTPTAAEEAEPPARTGYQVVGVDRQQLLFVDTSEAEWSVRRVGVGALAASEPLQSAVFLGCGDHAAVRSGRRVLLLDRDGRGQATFSLPSRRTHAERVDAAMARYGAEYGATPEPLTTVTPGALARGRNGRLLMERRVHLGAFRPDLQGCFESPEPLRVEIDTEEFQYAPCDSPEREPVDLWHGTEASRAWQCARHELDGEEAAPAPPWLEGGLAPVARAIPIDPQRCPDAAPGDPYERLARCVGPGPLTVCRRGRDPVLFASVQGDAAPSGCGQPETFLVTTEGLVGRTGEHVEAFTIDDDLLFVGGDRGWYLVGPGRPAVAVGAARPDVVFARPTAPPSTAGEAGH